MTYRLRPTRCARTVVEGSDRAPTAKTPVARGGYGTSSMGRVGGRREGLPYGREDTRAGFGSQGQNPSKACRAAGPARASSATHAAENGHFVPFGKNQPVLRRAWILPIGQRGDLSGGTLGPKWRRHIRYSRDNVLPGRWEEDRNDAYRACSGRAARDDWPMLRSERPVPGLPTRLFLRTKRFPPLFPKKPCLAPIAVYRAWLVVWC